MQVVTVAETRNEKRERNDVKIRQKLRRSRKVQKLLDEQDDLQKERVQLFADLKELGATVREIAEQHGLSEGAVWKVLKRAQQQ